jgi:hypothetical protein
MAISGAATESGAAAYISNATPTTLITNAQGAGKIVRVAKLLILNVDTAANVLLQLYKVASGGSISGDDWKILKDYIVKPSNGLFGTEDIRECAGMLLDNGDSLRALAGTASKLRYDLSTWNES